MTNITNSPENNASGLLQTPIASAFCYFFNVPSKQIFYPAADTVVTGSFVGVPTVALFHAIWPITDGIATKAAELLHLDKNKNWRQIKNPAAIGTALLLTVAMLRNLGIFSGTYTDIPYAAAVVAGAYFTPAIVKNLSDGIQAYDSVVMSPGIPKSK
jgi:hypothetical protein